MKSLYNYNFFSAASQSERGGDILSRAKPPVGFEPSGFQVGAVQEAAYTGSTGQWGEEERIHSIEHQLVHHWTKY